MLVERSDVEDITMPETVHALVAARTLENDWLPPEPDRIYSWDDMPQLVEDYAAGTHASYFPTFATTAAASYDPTLCKT